MAQRLTGLVVHLYRHIGMDDTRGGAQRRPIREQPFKHRPATDDDKFSVRMPLKRYIGARHHNWCTVVATHGVEGNTNLLWHRSTLAGPAPDFGFRRPGARFTARDHSASDCQGPVVRIQLSGQGGVENNDTFSSRPSIARILELGQYGKRTRSTAFLDRRRKPHPRLARIAIDTEHEEFGHDHAQVGRAIG